MDGVFLICFWRRIWTLFMTQTRAFNCNAHVGTLRGIIHHHVPTTNDTLMWCS